VRPTVHWPRFVAGDCRSVGSFGNLPKYSARLKLLNLENNPPGSKLAGHNLLTGLADFAAAYPKQKFVTFQLKKLGTEASVRQNEVLSTGQYGFA
jgi:hypothetical protein